MNKKTALNFNPTVDFYYSTTVELMCSLHVVSNHYHHPTCISWYDKVVQTIPMDLIDRIRDFGAKYVDWSFAIDLADYYIEPPEICSAVIVDDFPRIVESIRQMDDELFQYFFLGATLLAEREYNERILIDNEFLSRYDPVNVKKYISEEDIEYFLAHYNQVRAEMLDIMQTYYDLFFKEEWQKNSVLYRSAIINEYKAFQQASLQDYIIGLHDDLSIEDGTLIMSKYYRFEIKTVDVKHLKILFSTYCYPHLFMNSYGDILTIYEHLLIPNMSTVFSSIASSAKILSDATRLAIIKLLLSSSLNTKELAKILNVTPACVSQHLKIMKEAGFVTSSRDRNIVYYSLNDEELNNYMQELIHFFQD